MVGGVSVSSVLVRCVGTAANDLIARIGVDLDLL
jgi:hypothetical protein